MTFFAVITLLIHHSSSNLAFADKNMRPSMSIGYFAGREFYLVPGGDRKEPHTQPPARMKRFSQGLVQLLL